MEDTKTLLEELDTLTNELPREQSGATNETKTGKTVVSPEFWQKALRAVEIVRTLRARGVLKGGRRRKPRKTLRRK